MRNPNWSRDEVILAFDFYFKNRDDERVLRKSYQPLHDLSETLNRLADVQNVKRTPTFRNVNGWKAVERILTWR